MIQDPAVLAAIASPRRREILRLLWDHEQAAGAIHDAMPDVTFGAVSLQLRVLSEAGLVTVARRAASASTGDARAPGGRGAGARVACGPTRSGS